MFLICFGRLCWVSWVILVSPMVLVDTPET